MTPVIGLSTASTPSSSILSVYDSVGAVLHAQPRAAGRPAAVDLDRAGDLGRVVLERHERGHQPDVRVGEGDQHPAHQHQPALLPGGLAVMAAVSTAASHGLADRLLPGRRSSGPPGQRGLDARADQAGMRRGVDVHVEAVDVASRPVPAARCPGAAALVQLALHTAVEVTFVDRPCRPRRRRPARTARRRGSRRRTVRPRPRRSRLTPCGEPLGRQQRRPDPLPGRVVGQLEPDRQAHAGAGTPRPARPAGCS